MDFYTDLRHTYLVSPNLRSPFRRAIVPIIGGIAFFAALFGMTWLMAVYITNHRDVKTESGAGTFVVGSVVDVAESVAQDGPVMYPDLRDSNGTRSIVIEHFGDEPTKGWQVYFAYPADKDPTCLVTQIKRTHTFVDCDGRTVNSDQLQPPPDARPIVENGTTLLIDLDAPVSTTLVP